PSAPAPPLFPYTTLFRSGRVLGVAQPGLHQEQVVVHFLAREGLAELGEELTLPEVADQEPQLADVPGRRFPDQEPVGADLAVPLDRKSTRLNSSHVAISY